MTSEPDFETASALIAEGKFEEALDVYRPYVDVAPKYRYNLAVCLYQMARYPDAAAELEKLQDEPALAPDAQFLLGFCYKAMKQPLRAQAHFEKMLETFKGETRGRCKVVLATLLEDLDRRPEAEKAYEELLNEPIPKQDLADILRRLAAFREERKDWIGALRLYEQSLPNSGRPTAALVCKFRMAVCYMELSTPAQGVELLQEIVRDAPEGSFLQQSAQKMMEHMSSQVRAAEKFIRGYE